MDKFYVLYNPTSNAGRNACSKLVKTLTKQGHQAELTDITTLDYKQFFSTVETDAKVLAAGGDGTLNSFVNNLQQVEHVNQIWYYPCGTGNDFWKDVTNCSKKFKPICIDNYIVDLPTVTVNGQTRLFVNGAGLGFDGYCCAEVAKKHAQGKHATYTSVAVKGLLGDYKRPSAIITVDGVEHKMDNIWLISTMNGRYCGGGMMFTPRQNRMDIEGKLSVYVLHSGGGLETLLRFPQIFKGKHEKYTKICTFFTGHTITVRFNVPHSFQADGDVVTDVIEYTASK